MCKFRFLMMVNYNQNFVNIQHEFVEEAVLMGAGFFSSANETYKYLIFTNTMYRKLIIRIPYFPSSWHSL